MGTGVCPGAGGGGDNGSTAVGGLAVVCVGDWERESGVYTIEAEWDEMGWEGGGAESALRPLLLSIGTGVGIDVEERGDVVGSGAFETAPSPSDGSLGGGFWRCKLVFFSLVGCVWDSTMIERE
ncbi:predicted protein [Histoplasma capsulatum var. duboisii H88]|uniref:Predicted protein n=1 Tax=Ajellomyces capsulatus (strain H88) TaxID=544711 RepID=F0U9H2_AJEC8|nr:predicted protein [Histoplasma capsulatum var. duboisii H88]